MGANLSTARGTTEAQGPGALGGGSQFINAVKKVVPGTTAYAVKYPASFGASSPDIGVQDTLKYFETKPKECPQQLYVMSGYSQGGVVMHRAAVKMDKGLLKNRVVAAVTFGDGGQLATKEKPLYNSPVGPIPVWPSELDGRIKFNCVPGDPVSRYTFEQKRSRSLMDFRYAQAVAISLRIWHIVLGTTVTTAQRSSKNSCKSLRRQDRNIMTIWTPSYSLQIPQVKPSYNVLA
jgi:hypothetical protein